MGASLQRVLGFDYGTRQIGVAVGQTLTGHANPLKELRARDGIPDWDQIGTLLKEWQPDALIVGLPLNMDGSPSEMSARAEKFARRLHGRFQLPVHCVDERLSTFEAKQTLRDSGRGAPASYRDNPVDSLAAALLLETWLAGQKEKE
ncbi:Holliday junction resolvase RuvX [Pseudomonas sp. G11-1]|uniref:Putative pre-16S rRNA nuclease n=1 Tax=Halopseudomonas bauzanensis TaxID=653930 RepID=A0A031MBF1_9GAMM|nr:Holliday junction resolvase RuvX [Halopseudomonas bauzanensis]MCO5786791.1 Holliday junction resolvase RuvX [Pseudomonas sp. G11-1]MCO5790017.1 Holliday junction resolvase RuvX [Pseudomonas sp. G11-2]EZQ17917.1 Holliday junction resolvase [Halopseudomonas bauzanensis]SER91362.1 putative holliday junction resolvase [Halopseudomonas bauzanensis]SFL90408.1 putative holliday junction resolvase [Halopseudomonas bauzanensis]